LSAFIYVERENHHSRLFWNYACRISGKWLSSLCQ